MLYVYSIVFAVLFLNAETLAQTPAPTPSGNPSQRNISPVMADNARFDRLRSIEMMNPKNQTPRHPLLDPKKGIYRKPGKDEIIALAVDEKFLTQYSAFLRNANTGIIRLNSDLKCVSDIDTVSANEDCIPYRMPGAGIAFSFRTEGYRLPRLADLILVDGIFRTGGVFQQVAMADIGDVPLDEIGLNSNGLKFLVEMKPARDSKEFTEFDENLSIGINSNGFLYRKGNPVQKNSTYVMRSIAYRGQYVRSIDGIPYDELSFDKRRDVIVAFRVIDWVEDGDPTIIWKVFRNTEAPKLKIVK